MLLLEQYGEKDIGILFTFFLNILSLKIGESFVISPDEPHAYIRGDLMEAMVNSDNVVRGGLTPKLKDTKTLMNMLRYEFKERKQNSGEQVHKSEQASVVRYPTGYDEFMVTHVKLSGEEKVPLCFNSLSIVLALSGSAQAEVEGWGSQEVGNKNAYFVMPGQQVQVSKHAESGEDVSLFIASCEI